MTNRKDVGRATLALWALAGGLLWLIDKIGRLIMTVRRAL